MALTQARWIREATRVRNSTTNHLCYEALSPEKIRGGRPHVRGKRGRVSRTDGIEQNYEAVIFARSLQRLQIVVRKSRASRNDDKGVVLGL